MFTQLFRTWKLKWRRCFTTRTWTNLTWLVQIGHKIIWSLVSLVWLLWFSTVIISICVGFFPHLYWTICTLVLHAFQVSPELLHPIYFDDNATIYFLIVNRKYSRQRPYLTAACDVESAKRFSTASMTLVDVWCEVVCAVIVNWGFLSLVSYL